MGEFVCWPTVLYCLVYKAAVPYTAILEKKAVGYITYTRNQSNEINRLQ
jgi:hypothetical protein